MNDQDRDLIAALAEGRLSPDAAEAAIARIEADPELASEHANQAAALDFLTSSAAPRMTPGERSTLHTNLTEQLGLVGAPAPAPSKKRNPWWAPVFGLATAAAIVAAVVIFPGDSTDTFQEVSSDLGGESSARSETTVTATGAAEAPTSEEQSAADDGGISVYETDTVELDELLNEAGGADGSDEIQRRLSGLNFKSTVDLDPLEVEHCIDKLADEIPPDVAAFRVVGADVEGEATVIHVGFDYGEGVEDGLSFVLDDCSLVQHSGQG